MYVYESVCVCVCILLMKLSFSGSSGYNNTHSVIKHEPLSDQSKKLMSLIDDRQAVRSVKSLV